MCALVQVPACALILNMKKKRFLPKGSCFLNIIYKVGQKLEKRAGDLGARYGKIWWRRLAVNLA